VRGAALLRIVAVLALASVLSAQGSPPSLPAVVPRLESATEQLAHARGLKLRRYAGDPAEVPDRTRRAVRAYRAVRTHFPKARDVGAEAAFRAAQLLAASEDPVGARQEYRVAAELGAGTEFRARARLAIAAEERRAGRLARALGSYLDVARDPRAARRYRDRAWLQYGIVRAEQGEHAAAGRAWRGVAESAEDPLDRIRAFDRIGLRLLDLGDLEGAAGVFNECLRALAPDALESTRHGERVRRALERMRLVEALPRAVARRHDERASESSEKNL